MRSGLPPLESRHPQQVTRLPEPAIADAGGTLVLDASVAGTLDGLSVRWERDGVPLVDDGRIAGAGTATLTIVGATRADAGVYRLRVSVPGVASASDGVIVGVRSSPFGVADFDGDGDVDLADLLGFLAVLDAAVP